MKRYLISRDYAYSTKINLEGRMKIQSERAMYFSSQEPGQPRNPIKLQAGLCMNSPQRLN